MYHVRASISPSSLVPYGYIPPSHTLLSYGLACTSTYACMLPTGARTGRVIHTYGLTHTEQYYSRNSYMYEVYEYKAAYAPKIYNVQVYVGMDLILTIPHAWPYDMYV